MWSLRLNLLAYWQYYMYIHIIDPSSVFSLSGTIWQTCKDDHELNDENKLIYF